MSVHIDKGRALDGINMTPMIDCVFLLLIFFLVATRFEEMEKEMNVQLPQASEAMPLTAKIKEVFVNVNQQGQFIIGGQALDASQLLAALQQASWANPGRQTVIIRGDKRCPFEHIVTVMNACNQANIRDYKVQTADTKG